MSISSFVSWALVVLIGLGAVYLAARLITAAFFQSKSDYERLKDHGRTQNSQP